MKMAACRLGHRVGMQDYIWDANAYSNPLVYVDLDRNTPADIFNTGRSTAEAVAPMDSPAPSPMDVAAAIIAGGTPLVSDGVIV